MKSVKISVTQKDIDEGDRYNSIYCPVGLAMNRICPETPLDYVLVGKNTFKTGISNYEGKLPNNAHDFIMDFDYGLEVKPFEFEVSIP